MLKRLLFVFLFVLSALACWRVVSCSSAKPVISFYYWRTVYHLSEKEHQILTDLNVQRLYIRYFDVTADKEELHPTAVIQFEEKPSCEVIPVVYIKLDALEWKVLSAPSFALADSVMLLVRNISKSNEINFKEIQFDCDWNESTEKEYFKFIDRVRELNPELMVSSTIRLHQIKYQEKTGVPNVHTGTLMYYNMGRIAADTLNSIYDRDIARQYIGGLTDYNLPLNVAIPIFSWGVQSRGNQVVDLLNKINLAHLKNDTLFQQNSAREFTAIHNGVFEEVYFAQGDRLKLEYVSAEDIQGAIEDVSDFIRQPPREIILYDLDQLNFENQTYEKSFLFSLCNSF